MGGGGRDAGHGMNTDYVSVDQRRAATWREEGGDMVRDLQLEKDHLTRLRGEKVWMG